MALAVGNLVTFSGAPGIGRVGEVRGSDVRVDFFESAAEPVAESVWLPAADVRRTQLEEETRVFLRDAKGRWRAGRVIGTRDDYYFVKVPNIHGKVDVDEHRLFVRWDKIPRDPLQVLLSGADDTPRYRDAREPVRELLLKERAATASATGIMSAGVRIHPHQISAALRIIRDPIQRYLLADEVGMGKTIQAGLVMRQLLIDQPGRIVGLIVPNPLIAQWRSELQDKFFLDDFPTALGQPPYILCGHDDPESWRRLSDVDLLVVDEAHLLANTADPAAHPYAELAALAHSVPRALMLSATPFARSATTHLALLHLLDPALFRWEELGRFEELLAARSELAAAVFGLMPEIDAELQDLQFQQLRDLLPHDDVLQAAMERTLSVFGPEGTSPGDVDPVELERAIEVVRTHISETYRLHHRVIRNRRHVVARQKLDDEGLLTPFEFTGRGRPRVVRLEGSEEANLGSSAVADWATACSAAILDDNLDPGPYGRVLGVLMSRVGGPTNDLASVLRVRLLGISDSSVVTDSERAILDAVDVLPFEASVLVDLEASESTDALPQLAEALKKVKRSARGVVFCGRGQFAHDLVEAMKQVPGTPNRVYAHLRAQSEVEREQATADWRQGGGLLIADDSGDVGRNFQDASLVFHVRVPWNPNALEQRIGRVDRYGDHKAAQQFVVADEDRDGLPTAWLRVLIDGFGIFEESISGFEEAVDELGFGMWRACLQEGVEGLLARTTRIQSALRAERKRVNELDALESTFGGGVDGRTLAFDIARFEEHTARIEAAYKNLITGAEGFRLTSVRNRDGSITFERDHQDQPLFSPRLLRRLTAVDQARTGYFDRWQVAHGRRLFRRGNPFIDGVESLLGLDDRGQAVGMWRFDPRWPNDPFIYFGWDFLIEADVEPILVTLNDDALLEPVARRRADAAFAPQRQRVWIAANTEQPVASAKMRGYLDRPFNPQGDPTKGYNDQNLNAERIAALHTLLGGESNLAPVATACFEAGHREARLAGHVTAASERARLQVQSETDVVVARSRARAQAAGLVSDPGAFEHEIVIGRAIEAGVSDPVVRLVGVSCVVVSAQPWKSYV
ncbi:MAG TPA: protein DpdE [Propionicimonas sp.]